MMTNSLKPSVCWKSSNKPNFDMINWSWYGNTLNAKHDKRMMSKRTILCRDFKIATFKHGSFLNVTLVVVTIDWVSSDIESGGILSAAWQQNHLLINWTTFSFEHARFGCLCSRTPMFVKARFHCLISIWNSDSLFLDIAVVVLDFRSVGFCRDAFRSRWVLFMVSRTRSISLYRSNMHMMILVYRTKITIKGIK